MEEKIIEADQNKELYSFKVNDKDERHLKFQLYDK